ncbi:hypothetical protein [Nocardia sp. CA-120079]
MPTTPARMTSHERIRDGTDDRPATCEFAAPALRRKEGRQRGRP